LAAFAASHLTLSLKKIVGFVVQNSAYCHSPVIIPYGIRHFVFVSILSCFLCIFIISTKLKFGFRHMPDKIKRAVILMNLGSPDSTKVRDVRAYLNEFLMDERVIDSPYIVRTLLVKGMITPFRAPKSAEAYSAIWGPDGSPLVVIAHQLKQALQNAISEPIEVAMRYGNPSMKIAYDNLCKKHPGIEEVILLPLYPHYAMSSYETAVEHAKNVYNKEKYPFRITFVPPFYNHPAYISALAESIKDKLPRDSHLLFSYHSIPERHIKKSDITGNHCLCTATCCETPSPAHAYCYRHQCFVTTRLVTRQLGIPAENYSVSFQSRLGRSEWLKPSTTLRMDQMPKEGITNLSVVCPSFVSDCLETLEEIDIRERANFLKAGGESFTFIPCMNTHLAWIKAVVDIIGI
jgi:protoporphyrin/coproporphyrin ferrochelatase